MLRYLPFLLVLAVWIYAFIDCLNTPEKDVRNLPKLVWVAIIVLFGSVLFGPLAWFIGGRPRGRPVIAGEGSGGGRRPGRGGWVAPDDNPDFLRSLGEDRRKDEPREEPREEPRQESRQEPEDERGRERDEEGPEGRQGPDEDRR
ncbi:PLD nuclease N-terminal domain-containing protein [Streptomyces sp. NBC_01808]|uniref:PLD nuclease N-terminal domain-containing protein n=1 Tax=Streptomyces sp. NBC_01808 TaxID=2975947 RepID=UPI002DDB98BB|nr:PLD nuclease N-terminal domain-containing protein [Streptomyces sp. NBC_01808]WSA39743.1 PLD nuclease N-terminal domain-containing protein [Streptomyces sp. NBC_01808]